MGPSAGPSSAGATPDELAEYAPLVGGGCLRFGAPRSPPLTPISASSSRVLASAAEESVSIAAPASAPAMPPMTAPATTPGGPAAAPTMAPTSAPDAPP